MLELSNWRSLPLALENLVTEGNFKSLLNFPAGIIAL